MNLRKDRFSRLARRIAARPFPEAMMAILLALRKYQMRREIR
jgi:hypothetical protein